MALNEKSNDQHSHCNPFWVIQWFLFHSKAPQHWPAGDVGGKVSGSTESLGCMNLGKIFHYLHTFITLFRSFMTWKCSFPSQKTHHQQTQTLSFKVLPCLSDSYSEIINHLAVVIPALTASSPNFIGKELLNVTRVDAADVYKTSSCPSGCF